MNVSDFLPAAFIFSQMKIFVYKEQLLTKSFVQYTPLLTLPLHTFYRGRKVASEIKMFFYFTEGLQWHSYELPLKLRSGTFQAYELKNVRLTT